MAKKILLVDDEAHVLRVMKISLERAGFEVLTAKNGVDGLASTHEHRPDVMIVDIDMPKMNGKELCLKIHAELPNLRIPIFIATSRAEDEFRDWIDSFPMVSFLEKPLSLRNLVPSLQALLDETSDAINVVTGAPLD